MSSNTFLLQGSPKTAMEEMLIHDDIKLMKMLQPHYHVERDLERRTILHLAADAGAVTCVWYVKDFSIRLSP